MHVVTLIAALPALVQLSSERARQAVRQGCSFAKKQEPPPALLVVVPSEREPARVRESPTRGKQQCVGTLATSY